MSHPTDPTLLLSPAPITEPRRRRPALRRVSPAGGMPKLRPGTPYHNKLVIRDEKDEAKTAEASLPRVKQRRGKASMTDGSTANEVPCKISLPPPTPGASTPLRTVVAGIGEHPHTVKRTEYCLWRRITTVIHGRRRRRSSTSSNSGFRQSIQLESTPPCAAVFACRGHAHTRRHGWGPAVLCVSQHHGGE
jgi:hypothetical protein